MEDSGIGTEAVREGGDGSDVVAVGDVIMATLAIGRGKAQRVECLVDETGHLDLGADREPLYFAHGRFRKRDGTWSAVRRAFGKPWHVLVRALTKATEK